jgi:ribonuclease BN (tRNA processing enzyme)
VQELIDEISEGAAPTFTWQVVADGDRTTVGDIDLAFARTDHPVETLAVRAEHAGRVLAYTADTGSDFSFAPFGGPIHLALCEATLPPDQAGAVQHLTGAEAGALAREAGAERLLLTHLTPGSDAAQRRSEAGAAYDGPVTSAVPGHTHEV